jgi:voltage-gated potassium channel
MRRTPLQRVRLGAVALCLILIVSIVGYRLGGRGWLDALYMVVITVGTVGYGEHSQLAPGEKLWTIGVILFGISAAVFTMGGLFQMMAEGEIERALHSGRNSRGIDRLNGHIIICGYGRMGRILAHELQVKQQPLVIVDNEMERVNEAQAQGFLAVHGDATAEEMLELAGVTRAKCLVTALPSDAANVFITLTARNINSKLQIIARSESQPTAKKLMQAGATRVVLPATIGALRIAAMITHPSTVELMELVAGHSVLDVEVDELVVPAGSKLVGKTIAQSHTRHQHGLLIVAVKKAAGSMVFNPDSDLAFAEGDIVIVMGRVEDIERFRGEYQM